MVNKRTSRIFFNKKNSILFKITIYLFIIAVGYLLIISYPPVKLKWYDAPLFPMLSLIVAISLHSAISLLKFNGYWLRILTVMVLLAYSSNKIFVKKRSTESVYQMEKDGLFLKEIVTNNPNFKELTIFKIENNIEHYDQVLFYKRAFFIEKGVDVIIKHVPQFIIGEYVLVCKKELQDLLEKEFLSEVVFQNEIGILYQIIKEY